MKETTQLIENHYIQGDQQRAKKSATIDEEINPKTLAVSPQEAEPYFTIPITEIHHPYNLPARTLREKNRGCCARTR